MVYTEDQSIPPRNLIFSSQEHNNDVGRIVYLIFIDVISHRNLR